MSVKVPDDQVMLPVFGPSRLEDGSPRCSEWTRTNDLCSRKATVPANGRHGALCGQHAAQLRKGGRS